MHYSYTTIRSADAATVRTDWRFQGENFDTRGLALTLAVAAMHGVIPPKHWIVSLLDGYVSLLSVRGEIHKSSDHVFQTLSEHDEAWGGYRFVGRVYRDGSIILKRESVSSIRDITSFSTREG